MAEGSIFFLVINTIRMPRREDRKQYICLRIRKAHSFSKVAALIFATRCQQQLHAFQAKFVELIKRAKSINPLKVRDPCRLHHAVEHLAVVDADDVVTTRDAQRFHGVGHHHAHFGIGLDARCANNIGVELHELAETAGAGLFVAKHPAGAIAAIGQLNVVEIFGDMAGQRCGQIIAQAQPLVVIILKREHAFVGPVLIGKELSQCVGVFDKRGFHRLKAKALIDQFDLCHHLIGGADV